MSKILIRDATLVNEGVREKGSLLVGGNRIARIWREGDSPSLKEVEEADLVIEAEGLLCLPGVIDDQVHFREPGLTHKGDIETESRCAVLGGVTSYMEMPNTIPQTTTLEAWREKMRRAETVSFANYAFYMGATNDNIEVLHHLDRKHTPGVKVFMGSSTGNMLVDDEKALERIFEESPVPIAVHSESEEVIAANKKRVIEQYGPDPDVSLHPQIRDVEACYASTVKAVALARKTGARLHILHLSTQKELSLLEVFKPLKEKKITSEVCVHHLWFDDSAYTELGTKVKWNPAIKTSCDREALRAAVRDGLIDVIATDHAPHLLSEKEGGALRAASGGPLVEHSLVMMLELAYRGVFPVERVVEYMSHRPAELFGIVDRGYLRVGYYADIVLIDPSARWTVSADNIHAKCKWSPLEGVLFHHRVKTTILNGEVVVKDGNVCTDKRAAMPLEFDHPKRNSTAL